MAAFKDARPRFRKGGPEVLPRLDRLLQGWQKLDPGHTRPPLPLLALALIATHGLELAGPSFPLALLTMFFAYLRPGEALSRREADLVAPSGVPAITTAGIPAPAGCFTLHLHPASRGERSKTGATDESVMLDAADAPWLGPLLQQLLAGVPHRHLFGLSYPQAKSFWDSAVQRAGLAAIKPVMYMCRHGGPSHDRRMRLRSQEEVKRRLRLVSDSALRRYEAHALIQLEENKLGESLLAEARTAWRLLPE